MNPEGRERRAKMGFYHSISGVGVGAERMPPRKSKNLKMAEFVVVRSAAAGTEGDSRYVGKYLKA